jgi:hypothetical protein
METIQPFDLGHQALNTNDKISTRLCIMPAHLLLCLALNHMSNSSLSQHGAEVCRLDLGKLCLTQISEARDPHNISEPGHDAKDETAVNDEPARVSWRFQEEGGTNSMSRRIVLSGSPEAR